MTDNNYHKTINGYHAKENIIRNYREQEMMGNTFRKVRAYDLLLSEKIEYPFIRGNFNKEKAGGTYMEQMNISSSNSSCEERIKS